MELELEWIVETKKKERNREKIRRNIFLIIIILYILG